MKENTITVNNLKHLYGKEMVINGVSFNIKKGEFFIIIGPNGSGKTTLVKLLSGVEQSSIGEINILGSNISEYSRKNLAKNIAFVPQFVPDEFPFTVREVVLMGRSPHLGLLGFENEGDNEIAEKAMDFTGILHLADRKVDLLSGGERQRTYIARAICQQPKIILLDEPTASLDIAHQLKIMDLMEKLKNENDVTVVMISHDVNLAAMYCDSLLLLKDGKIINEGKPENVLTYETLEEAYGCTILVEKSPLGDYPRIIPVPEKYIPAG